MKFWDSSAIVPLIIAENNTDYCLEVLSKDPEMLIWCLSRVEVISALCRRLSIQFTCKKSFYGSKTMATEPFAVSFNILLKEEDGFFIAHCLELDIVATGLTASEARMEILDLIKAQLDYAFNNDNLDNLYHPAPSEVWQEFYSCLNQEQERVCISEEEAVDRFVPPWIIANTCRSERKTTHG